MKIFPRDANESTPVDEDLFISAPMSRRSFLVRGGAALAAVSALIALPLPLSAQVARDTVFTKFSRHQKRIMATVQEHLFPSEPHAPGASDINATKYLETVLQDSRFKPSTQDFILNGIDWLEETSIEKYSTTFTSLSDQQKESLLRHVVNDTRWGSGWISRIMYHIFEALLSDPVYGGNPNGIGWKWLEHTPGFPRPPRGHMANYER